MQLGLRSECNGESGAFRDTSLLPASCLPVSPPGAHPALFSPLQPAADPFPLPVLRPAPRHVGAWPVSSTWRCGRDGGAMGAGSAPPCQAQGFGALPGGSDPAQPPRGPAWQQGDAEPSPGSRGCRGLQAHGLQGTAASPIYGSCPPQAHRDHPIPAAAVPPPRRAPPSHSQDRAGTAARPQVGDTGTHPRPTGVQGGLAPARESSSPGGGAGVRADLGRAGEQSCAAEGQLCLPRL